MCNVYFGPFLILFSFHVDAQRTKRFSLPHLGAGKMSNDRGKYCE